MNGARVVDLARVRRALARLDALVRRYARLATPAAQGRLARALDLEGRSGERGSDGSKEES
jgi:hypothetical protein